MKWDRKLRCFLSLNSLLPDNFNFNQPLQILVLIDTLSWDKRNSLTLTCCTGLSKPAVWSLPFLSLCPMWLTHVEGAQKGEDLTGSWYTHMLTLTLIIVTCTVLRSCPLADGAAEVSRHFLSTQYTVGLQDTERNYCHCFVTGTG